MAMNGPTNNADLEDLDGDESVFSEINITPLTDVFLVLLIIFMVTSSAVSQSGVKVNLPKAGAASNSKDSRGVTVTLNSGGQIFVGKEATNIDGLEAFLRAHLEKAENKSVILAGDQEVLLGSAIQVMNIARKAGASKFGIATKSGIKSGAPQR